MGVELIDHLNKIIQTKPEVDDTETNFQKIILDPRYKFNFIEWCYKKLYGGDYIKETLKVKEKLFALFINYSKSESSSRTKKETLASQSDNSRSLTSTIITSQFLQDFDSFDDEDNMPRKSEIEIYLDEPRLDRKVELDILHYWRGNQYRFPGISAMARDVLCIPISTVASESAFSNSGRILDQYRSAMKHDIVEALVCVKDWLYVDQKDLMDPDLEEVTENIIKLDIVENEKEHENSTNSVA